MPYLVAAPEMLVAAAADVAGIGSSLNVASLAAAAPTTPRKPFRHTGRSSRRRRPNITCCVGSRLAASAAELPTTVNPRRRLHRPQIPGAAFTNAIGETGIGLTRWQLLSRRGLGRPALPQR